VQHTEHTAVGWTLDHPEAGVKMPNASQPAGQGRGPMATAALDETRDGSSGESLAPAVTRAAAILDVLAEDGAVALGPTELARRLGLPKSSIANICGALADVGLVRRVGTGFALGRRLAELGGAYLVAVDMVQEFYEAARGLPVASEEPVQLAEGPHAGSIALLKVRATGERVPLLVADLRSLADQLVDPLRRLDAPLVGQASR